MPLHPEYGRAGRNRAAKPNLRNGSVGGRLAAQVLKADQHRKRPLQLAVEMNVVLSRGGKLAAENLAVVDRPFLIGQVAEVRPRLRRVAE